MIGQIPLSTIARCSADGRVFMAFGHYIAAGDGYLLLFPVGVAYKDRAIEVVAGCPVPVEEVSALLDEPLDHQRTLAEDHPLRHRLSALWPDGWCYDMVPVMPHAWRRVLRAVNENGIRYAEVVR